MDRRQLNGALLVRVLCVVLIACSRALAIPLALASAELELGPQLRNRGGRAAFVFVDEAYGKAVVRQLPRLDLDHERKPRRATALSQFHLSLLILLLLLLLVLIIIIITTTSVIEAGQLVQADLARPKLVHLGHELEVLGDALDHLAAVAAQEGHGDVRVLSHRRDREVEQLEVGEGEHGALARRVGAGAQDDARRLPAADEAVRLELLPTRLLAEQNHVGECGELAPKAVRRGERFLVRGVLLQEAWERARDRASEREERLAVQPEA